MSGRKVNIRGVPVTVVSDSEAEKVDFLVCMPADTPSPFDDNLFGFCVKCGVRVMFRWHAPRKPQRICLQCATKLEMKGDDK